MDAIWAVFTYLQGIIESSNTIKSRLGGSVELFPYGSVINGLFDVKKSGASSAGSKENPEANGQFSLESDLDLTLIIDDSGNSRTNKTKTHKEIIDLIYHKLKDAEKKHF